MKKNRSSQPTGADASYRSRPLIASLCVVSRKELKAVGRERRAQTSNIIHFQDCIIYAELNQQITSRQPVCHFVDVFTRFIIITSTWQPKAATSNMWSSWLFNYFQLMHLQNLEFSFYFLVWCWQTTVIRSLIFWNRASCGPWTHMWESHLNYAVDGNNKKQIFRNDHPPKYCWQPSARNVSDEYN